MKEPGWFISRHRMRENNRRLQSSLSDESFDQAPFMLPNAVKSYPGFSNLAGLPVSAPRTSNPTSPQRQTQEELCFSPAAIRNPPGHILFSRSPEVEEASH
jgi:hypothetical protein